MPLLSPIDPPRPTPTALPVRWASWSPSTRARLQQLQRLLPEMRKPRLLQLREVSDYPLTYALEVEEVPDPNLRQWVVDSVGWLRALRVPRKLLLVHAMIDSTITGRTVHSFFSLLRSALVERTGRSDSALCPQSAACPAGSFFPLHCDFWRAELLMNIFDQVQIGVGGHPMFVSMSDVSEMMARDSSVPREVLMRFDRLVQGPHQDGDYGRLYGLLHSSRSEWARDLRRNFHRATTSLALGRGEGYLLHDRSWLHGHGISTVPSTPDRIHRLVFDSTAAERLRSRRNRRWRARECSSTTTFR